MFSMFNIQKVRKELNINVLKLLLKLPLNSEITFTNLRNVLFTNASKKEIRLFMLN